MKNMYRRESAWKAFTNRSVMACNTNGVRIRDQPCKIWLVTRRYGRRCGKQLASITRKSPTIVEIRESAVVGETNLQTWLTLSRREVAPQHLRLSQREMVQRWCKPGQIRYENPHWLRLLQTEPVRLLSIRPHHVGGVLESHNVRHNIRSFRVPNKNYSPCYAIKTWLNCHRNRRRWLDMSRKEDGVEERKTFPHNRQICRARNLNLRHWRCSSCKTTGGESPDGKLCKE